MKKLLFIINPMAGRQQAQTDLYKMVKIFADHDYEVTVYPTRARLDCTRKVLEDAGLVIAERRGRERWNHLNAIPIQDIHDRWIGPHAAAAAAKLARFKQAVETK